MKQLPFISLILLLSTTLFVAACGATVQAQTATPQPKAEAPANPVQVTTVQTGTIELILKYAGTLQAKQNVNLVPEVNGQIASMLVEVGDQVKAGDPIATIQSDTYAVQVRQAEAALEAANIKLAKMKEGSRPEQITAAQAAVDLARANLNAVANVNGNERTVAASSLASAEANLRKAQAEYDKIAWAGNVGETPQATALEQATIAYQTALASYNLQTNPSDAQLAPLEAQLSQAELNLALTLKPYRNVDFEEAQAAIKQAEAGLELARIQLNKTTIRAPFDGVVAATYVDQGSTVGPQNPIALFVSNDLEVLISVEENRIGQVHKDESAALQVAAYSDQDFPGVVTSVALVADQVTHTFNVKVTPLDKDGLLRSGMYADVFILTRKDQDVLLAPRAAVTQIDNQEVVYVVKDGTAEKRPVTTGLTDDNHIEILSGLNPGETVVIAGQSDLVDGARINVVNNL